MKPLEYLYNTHKHNQNWNCRKSQERKYKIAKRIKFIKNILFKINYKQNNHR